MMADEANEMGMENLTKPEGVRGRSKRAHSPRREEAAFADELDPELGELDAMLKPASTAQANKGRRYDGATQDGVKDLVGSVLRWLDAMRRHFGDGLLLQIFFVYFTQGIRSTLCSLGTSYYLNETLALKPAQSEALRGTAAIPWIIKPLYGMLSDTVPIWGTRRKSYLLIFSAVSAMAYMALALPSLITSYEGALIALVVASLGIAFCDVVIDGKVVEAARSEKEDMAGNLQTLSWISLSVGSVLGSMISGFVLNHFGPHGVFFLSGVGPICVAAISFGLHEANARVDSSQSIVDSVQEQCRSLAGVVVDPLCWRPMLWIFLSNALPPSLGEAMFSFKTNGLNFSKSFLGFISTVGSITLLCTTAAYNAYFRDMPFRTMFLRIQLAAAFVSFSEVLLVSRWNVSAGIDDRFFIFGDEILSDVVARLKHMPSLVLCAKICPPGIEGTMFALLMSIYNFSWSVSSYGGSWLCNYLSISKTDFSGLTIAVIVRSFAKLAPVLLLFMVPETISSSSSSSATWSSKADDHDSGSEEESQEHSDNAGSFAMDQERADARRRVVEGHLDARTAEDHVDLQVVR